FLCLLLLVAWTNSQQCSHTSPCSPLKGGQPFQEPQQIHSANGQLIHDLILDVHNFTLDWLTVKRRLYNAIFPGPTYTIKAGDKFHLNFVNNLQEPDFRTSEENIFGFPNTTNIHTHGLHISSKEPQDNPFVVVPPNSTYNYKFDIKSDHPSGTYWYHPHFHGSTHFQNIGGMGGMLIVEDAPASMSMELASVSCPGNCQHDVQIVLQTFQYTHDEDSGFAMLQRDVHDYEGFRLNNITLESSTQTLEEWLEDSNNN
uniref:Plastocyanin-like domain-containing protein n=1 Tax=Ciona savignyi TaxID=51511 RepID=H2YB99_CIOSA